MLGIPGCHVLLRLDVEIRCEGKTLSEATRYYMSSLDPEEGLPEEFQEYIQQHWEIENCLH
jgi:predicted transposase YbfD/YdcC